MKLFIFLFLCILSFDTFNLLKNKKEIKAFNELVQNYQSLDKAELKRNLRQYNKISQIVENKRELALTHQNMICHLQSNNCPTYKSEIVLQKSFPFYNSLWTFFIISLITSQRIDKNDSLDEDVGEILDFKKVA